MRIDSRVAVAGEMLCRGEHGAGVRAFDVGGYIIGDLRGIFAKRAYVDDGIGGVGIHVGVWEEIPLHTDGARLQSSDASHFFRVFWITGSAKGHRVRKYGSAIQAHGNTALEIGGDDERELRLFLQAVQQVCRFEGLVLEKYRAIGGYGHAEGSDVILADVLAKLKPERVGIVHELHFGPDHEELADFFFGGHAAQVFFRPAAAVAIQMNWAGGLEALRGAVASGCAGWREQERGERQQRPRKQFR